MKVLIAGGGTAGHINPGLAIASHIKQKDKNDEVVFVGTRNGLENKLVPRAGYKLEVIRARGFRRKFSVDTFKSIKSIFDGFSDSYKLLNKYKPSIVIGTGGYVCGTMLFVAYLKGIPTLIHEANSIPGATNKILSKFVDGVAISFKDSKKYFKGAKYVQLTGNPIRKDLFDIDKSFARETVGIKNKKPSVVVFGGSRGAERINNVVLKMIEDNYKGEFNLTFATGEKHFDHIKNEMEKFVDKDIKIEPYIYDMANTLGSADLVITRAGAITVSEIAALGIPAILIPSPYVTANHQEHNARELEKSGGAVVVLEKELSSDILYNQICSLAFESEKLLKMSNSLKRIGIKDATEKIYSMVVELIKR